MEEDDLYVFPQSVHLAAKPRRVNTSDALKMGILLWFLAMVLISIFAISFFKSRGLPVYVYWLTASGINLIVLTTVWRYFIIDENAKKEEMKTQGTFNNYARVRGLSPVKVWERKDSPLPIFEYNNGGCFAIIKFTYGSNNATLSAGNSLFFKDLLREIYTRNLDYSSYVLTEHFKHSEEASFHLQKLSKCEEPTLATTAGRLVKTVFDLAEGYSGTETTYLLIKGKSRAYHEVLLMMANYIDKLLEEYSTSFRAVSYGDEKDYTRLIKEHYGLEVVDASKMKVDDLEEESRGNVLTVLKVISYDGDVKYNKNLIPKHVPRIKRVN